MKQAGRVGRGKTTFYQSGPIDMIRIAPLILLLAVFAAGCASTEDAYQGPRTTVEVVNNNFYDMNIFIVRGTQRIRLGNVRSNSTRVLTIPAYIAETGGSFRFLADPVGGNRTPVSQEMYVTPGDQVRLVIPAI